ncbi:MAG: hypothetical protein LBI34_01250 [Puniceicoccales bacterium]|jgi:hypothetical protein|nr:hypothetical protein [Puniceicoccales bacterium]
MLDLSVVSHGFDTSHAAKSLNQTIIQFAKAVCACEGNSEKQDALLQKLLHVTTLKVDLALFKAVSVWENPSLSALALLSYGSNLTNNEDEKKSFVDAIERLMPEVKREISAKTPIEGLILLLEWGLIFFDGLENSLNI